MKTVLSSSLILLTALSSAQLYHVTDLGTLGTKSYAYGVNSSGQVVGYYVDASNVNHGFLASAGVMQDLGSLFIGGTTPAGINSSGQIVAGDYILNPCGTVITIRTGIGAGEWLVANAINDSGQVVGQETTGNFPDAFLYSSGTIFDLGWLGGSMPDSESWANGINSAGQVVGLSGTPSGDVHAFLYTGGAMVDLGTFGGRNSQAQAINDSGVVVGDAEIPGNTYLQAFAWTNGVMRNLGTLGGGSSVAISINNSGIIVGSSYLAGEQLKHGFVSPGTGMQDLNSLLDASGAGVTITAAESISNSGQIAAWGTTATSNGNTHALLLTPVSAHGVLPSGYSLFRGTLVGGTIFSLQFNDPWYLTVQPGPTTQSNQPPVQVQVSGTSPTLTPASLLFTFTGHVNTVSIAQSLQLYNFTTSAYETVSTGPATKSADSTVSVTASGNLTRFVNPATNEVRARVTFIATGPTSLSQWTASLGVVNWIIQ